MLNQTDKMPIIDDRPKSKEEIKEMVERLLSTKEDGSPESRHAIA